MYHVMEGMMVPAALGIDTLDALRAKAVAEPGKLNYGTLGERTTTDAFRQWLGEHWNTKFVAIPYKGGSEIISALLGNDIDVTKIGVGNMVSQLKEGKIKILALNAAKRSPELPNVPTFKETGLDAFPGGPIFWGVVVPTGTPAPVVAKLHDELLAIFQSQKFLDFARTELSRPGRRLDRRLRRLPQEGPPGRQGGGGQVYEVTARGRRSAACRTRRDSGKSRNRCTACRCALRTSRIVGLCDSGLPARWPVPRNDDASLVKAALQVPSSGHENQWPPTPWLTR